jgi:hypothetical protein
MKKIIIFVVVSWIFFLFIFSIMAYLYNHQVNKTLLLNETILELKNDNDFLNDTLELYIAELKKCADKNYYRKKIFKIEQLLLGS